MPDGEINNEEEEEKEILRGRGETEEQRYNSSASCWNESERGCLGRSQTIVIEVGGEKKEDKKEEEKKEKRSQTTYLYGELFLANITNALYEIHKRKEKLQQERGQRRRQTEEKKEEMRSEDNCRNKSFEDDGDDGGDDENADSDKKQKRRENDVGSYTDHHNNGEKEEVESGSSQRCPTILEDVLPNSLRSSGMHWRTRSDYTLEDEINITLRTSGEQNDNLAEMELIKKEREWRGRSIRNMNERGEETRSNVEKIGNEDENDDEIEEVKEKERKKEKEKDNKKEEEKQNGGEKEDEEYTAAMRSMREEIVAILYLR